MARPAGVKEAKPRKRKATEPGKASWNRLWTGGHYKDKGLSLELFKKLASQPCHYCGALPKPVNCYGKTYEHHKSMYKSHCSYEWWNEQWIYANGVDKMTHQDTYLDTSNLVPCCTICNFMKQRLGHDEFIEQCKRIANHKSSEEI